MKFLLYSVTLDGPPSTFIGNFLKKILIIAFFISYTSLQAEPKLEVRQKLEQTSVITGEDLRGIVYIKNSGDELLKISGVSSSCGCTTLRLKKRLISPEKEVELRFIVDTRGKLGLIEKTITIHTNTVNSPHIETVYFHALPSRMEGAATQSIFEPPCAVCHLDSGVEKYEKALFEAVCAMCHPSGEFNLKNPQALGIMISEGNAKIGMPSFGEYFTEKQIQSIVLFLSKNKNP
jgi:hypothetical protein